MYKKPSVAATVAVYCCDTASLLVVRRRTAPYLGKYAFPGGYIETDQEDLEHAGVRELMEETGLAVDVKLLHLVDVRSSPTRDPRGHVIDVGFLYVLEKQQELALETSETYPEWIPLGSAAGLDYAFDHLQMYNGIMRVLTLQGILKEGIG